MINIKQKHAVRMFDEDRFCHSPVFSIKKSLRVLFTLTQCFSNTYTLLFYWKIKSCCDRYFPQQIRPQTTVQLYVLRDYSNVRIGFNIINKRHILPIVYSVNLNSLTLSVPEKLKTLVFEIPMIPLTLNINNQRTTTATSINLDIIRKLIAYSLNWFL